MNYVYSKDWNKVAIFIRKVSIKSVEWKVATSTTFNVLPDSNILMTHVNVSSI